MSVVMRNIMVKGSHSLSQEDFGQTQASARMHRDPTAEIRQPKGGSPITAVGCAQK